MTRNDYQRLDNLIGILQSQLTKLPAPLKAAAKDLAKMLADHRARTPLVVIEIETSNAAFGREGDDAPRQRADSAHELARILRDLADYVDDDIYPASLRDVNGNRVGIVEYQP